MKLKFHNLINQNKHNKIINKIDDKIDSIIKADLKFYKILKKFIISSGGKRIRPLVHYYFSKLLNYEGEEWIDVGAIGEIIHAASLLHDDVIDNSSTRRGKPAFHIHEGNKKTILGGDYLLSCGIDHLRKLKSGFDLLPGFTRVIRNLATAEILQMENEKNPQITEKIYEKIIIGKTAELFACMTESASIITGQLHQKKLFYGIGLQMGKLFQIRDDYFDYFSSEEKLGKKPYSDFNRGLITYPLIKLKKCLTKKENQNLFKNWGNDELRISKKELLIYYYDKYKIKEMIEKEIDKNIHKIQEKIQSVESKYTVEKQEILETLKKLKV